MSYIRPIEIVRKASDDLSLRDRSVQYMSIRYSERLVEAGGEPSAGRVGNSCDNTLA